ncbi:MAG: peptidoglycan-binding domain-containing protein [Candidatus Paceibacterota bacterium]
MQNLVEGYDFTGYPTLRFGDDRKEVVDLKTVLNRQDPSPSLAVDNAFDVNLKNAVIDFQEKNGLTPDAVVGSMMYKKLNEFQGIKPKTTKTPEKETVEFPSGL